MDESPNYYIKVDVGFSPTDNKYNCIPVRHSDNILVKQNIGAEYSLYSQYNGNKITDIKEYQSHLIRFVKEQRYYATNRAIIHAYIDGINVLYLSLDDSNLSESNGFHMGHRLFDLIISLNKIIKDINGDCLIFLNEASKPQFTEQVRDVIAKTCNLKYLGENSKIVAYCTMNYSELIGDIALEYIGLGIKFTNGSVVWGIPNGTNLDEVHETIASESLCAIGNFGRDPREISCKYRFAIPKDVMTFYGAFFDIVDVDENWIEI